MGRHAKTVECRYSDKIECIDTTRCRECGWCPAVDMQRRTAPQEWQTAPDGTQRLVFRRKKKEEE